MYNMAKAKICDYTFIFPPKLLWYINKYIVNKYRPSNPLKWCCTKKYDTALSWPGEAINGIGIWKHYSQKPCGQLLLLQHL